MFLRLPGHPRSNREAGSLLLENEKVPDSQKKKASLTLQRIIKVVVIL